MRENVLIKNQMIKLPFEKEKVCYEILEQRKYSQDAVSYLAKRYRDEDCSVGILMEYYPDYYAWERTEENVLVAVKNSENFRSGLLAFLKSIDKILCKLNYGTDDLLQSVDIIVPKMEADLEEDFVSGFHKTYMKNDMDSSIGEYTGYIWIELPEGAITLDKYMDNLYMFDSSAYVKLLRLMDVFTKLAKSIENINKQGYCFTGMDLKDVIVTTDETCNTENMKIIIADVNMIYAVPCILAEQAVFYMLDDLREGNIDQKTDVYAFAFNMLYALTRDKDLLGGFSCDDEFELEYLCLIIDEAEWIRESEGYSKAYFKHCLYVLFRECLQQSKIKRPENISNVIVKLENMKEILNNVSNDTKDMKQYTKKKISPTKTATQRLVYDRLLYENFTDSKHIKVLVLGGGVYAQSFVDQALQAAQMPEWTLDIDVVSLNAPIDKEVYLEFRPAIKEFVRIDGEYPREEADEYANLNFIQMDLEQKFILGDREWNEKVLKELLLFHEGYRYIFIALGMVELNKAVAEILEDITDENYRINYAVDYKRDLPRDNSITSKVYAVWMRESELTDDKDMKDKLEDMAFNSHLSWYNSLNVDEKKMRSEFKKDSYNYSSSMAFALSIPYKLYAVGIDMADYNDELGAAEAFYDNVLEKTDTDSNVKALYDALIAMEHRRWVLEKVCAGWKPLKKDNGEIDYDTCLKLAAAKDEKYKRHACIVHSSAQLKLQEEYFQQDGKKYWNQSSKMDESLDELDTFSIKYHRKWKEKAGKVKERFSFYEGKIVNLEQSLPMYDDKVRESYHQFLFFLKNLYEEPAKSYASQYKYYEGKLIETVVKRVTKEEYQVISKMLYDLKAEFQLIIMSLNYEDYKLIDSTLINNLPFIMTYRKVTNLVQGFIPQRKNQRNAQLLIENVISAHILNPQKILYLFYFTKSDSQENFCKTVKCVLEYLDCHVKCQVSFRIAYESSINQSIIQSVRTSLEKIKKEYAGYNGISTKKKTNVRFHDYKLHACNNIEEACNWLKYAMYGRKDLLYNIRTPVFEQEEYKDYFLNLLHKADIAMFGYDIKSEYMNPYKGDSGFVKFINVNSLVHLSIDDIFRIAGAKHTMYEKIDFDDIYEKLWKLYCGSYLANNGSKGKIQEGGRLWKDLCDAMNKSGCFGDKSDEKDQNVIFEMKQPSPIHAGREHKTFYQSFYAPAHTYYTYTNIINGMRQQKLVLSSAKVKRTNSESCLVTIESGYNLSDLLNKIRDFQFLFHTEYKVEFFSRECSEYKNNQRTQVYGLKYESPYALVEKKYMNNSKTKELMDALDKEGLIRIFDSKTLPLDFVYGNEMRKEKMQDYILFRFSSERVKRLLEKAGTLFEVYAYYSIVKTGAFDEVVKGYEFNWDANNPETTKNEFDLICVKGLKTLIVECKSVYQLEQEYYTKLDSLVSRFGVNATPVILSNLYADNPKDIKNSASITRGKKMDIETVSTPDEINNIGQSLLNIIERE